MIAQGDIWLLEPPNDKQRPVLIVTRDDAIGLLNNLVVAPLTSTVRLISTCILLTPEQGIDRESVANFDNMTSVPKSLLTIRLGTLGPSGSMQICSALAALANC